MINDALHILARFLVRVCPLGSARAILGRIGRLFPAHGDRVRMAQAIVGLRGRGSCLSRALAIAARAPHADLVIGCPPRTNGRFAAHAWLEIAGEPIDPAETKGVEIARLRGLPLACKGARCF
jgi:Transglutaminase-like superfamily